MKAPISNKVAVNVRKVYPVLLALTWTVGLILGSIAFLSAEPFHISLMRSLSQAAVSIVSLLCVSLFPFLLSTAAAFFAAPWLLFCICFFKAFSIAYISTGICLVFGSGGWLFRLLIMFSSCFSAPVLYCFWLRSLQGTTRCKAICTAIALIGSLLACGFDYRFISPFLVSMIVYS